MSAAGGGASVLPHFTGSRSDPGGSGAAEAPDCACAPSQAAMAATSPGTSFAATSAMQSGAWALRVRLRQAPSWAAMYCASSPSRPGMPGFMPLSDLPWQAVQAGIFRVASPCDISACPRASSGPGAAATAAGWVGVSFA